MIAAVDVLAAGATATVFSVAVLVGLCGLVRANRRAPVRTRPVPAILTVHLEPQGRQCPPAGAEIDCRGVWR